MLPAPPLAARPDVTGMADFGAPSLAQLWLWLGVPLMGFVALVIAAIRGIATLRRGAGVPRGLSAGNRAMMLALALPIFPLIPIAMNEARIDYDIDVINTLMAWLSVLAFAGGCVWLTRSGHPNPLPPE